MDTLNRRRHAGGCRPGGEAARPPPHTPPPLPAEPLRTRGKATASFFLPAVYINATKGSSFQNSIFTINNIDNKLISFDTRRMGGGRKEEARSDAESRGESRGRAPLPPAVLRGEARSAPPRPPPPALPPPRSGASAAPLALLLLLLFLL